jgi:hypothetical protein
LASSASSGAFSRYWPANSVAPARRDEPYAAQGAERGGEQDRRVVSVLGPPDGHDLAGEEDGQRDVPAVLPGTGA